MAQTSTPSHETQARAISRQRLYRLALWPPELLLVLALLLTVTTGALAHNGKVAVAVPVQGIVVDGDLSDWPEGMTRYAIGNEADPAGTFRVGWDAAGNDLCVAVEVPDDAIHIDTTQAGRFHHQDGCDVYVNALHNQPEGRRLLHQAIWGHTRQVFDNGRETDLDVVARHGEGGHTYEWRLHMDAIGDGRVRLRPGMVIELDMAVLDIDRPESLGKFRTWGRQRPSRGHGNVQGDVLIARRRPLLA